MWKNAKIVENVDIFVRHKVDIIKNQILQKNWTELMTLTILDFDFYLFNAALQKKLQLESLWGCLKRRHVYVAV